MNRHESFDEPKSNGGFGRREFMTGTAMLAASAAVGKVATVRATAADAPERKIKLGVVGCGGRGLWIARLFRDHGGYEIHAVADYFQEVADAAGQELGVEPSRRFSGLAGYRRLIDSGVEAVALEAPPCFFPEHIQAAIEAGLHVFVAKPVAIDVPGCRQVEAAATKAAEQQQCFLVDYQMPTDPHVIECAERFRAGALGNLSMVKSFYYGGLFGDPPLTDTIESRLRSLVWVNDTAIGGSYHVNACIHPIQAMMWVLDKVPVAAAGISSIRRTNPHGDSHDMFGITYEFDDGLLWTHTGRHARGLTGPDDPLATCEFLGDAYMRIGYGGRALIRGGSHHYPGGSIDNLYAAGAIRNIATFYQDVVAGNVANLTVRMAIDSCLATILAREACLRKGFMTMDELLQENRRIEPDLTGLKS
ncbi:MAG: gfo/Idh/MocA family oxidoreductase [Planctomycetaceae bacterium]|nr:MAG: gfo/Idh/MocA family oxidoreductase [Planctomycetaceae bacterium]